MIYDYVQAFRLWVLLKVNRFRTRKVCSDGFVAAYLRYLVR